MTEEHTGFTLIELVVYIAIFIILITTITLFAIDFINTNTRNRIKKDVSLAAYSVIDAIIYEIERANSVYTPTSVFNNNPGQLSLETSQGLPPGETISYVDFYLDSNSKIYMKREGQNPQLIIPENLKVTDLEFEYFASASESVRINLTLGNITSASEKEFLYTLNSSATIRK